MERDIKNIKGRKQKGKEGTERGTRVHRIDPARGSAGDGPCSDSQAS